MIAIAPLCSSAMILALLCPSPREEEPSALEQDPVGWMDLIEAAGADLEGWSRVPIPPDGELNDESQWSIDPDTGHLVCTGDRGHEWLRWDAESRDGISHVEWRFTPVEEGPSRYNSGVYARNSADGRIWHQAQVGSESGGFLFGDTLVDGELKRINLRDRLTEQRVKPAGEWNTYEILFTGDRVTLWVNGATTNDWRDCEVLSGHVGVEAEGYRIEFREILFKPL